MKIRIVSRYKMKQILEDNPNLLDNNYWISICDIGDAEYQKSINMEPTCAPILNMEHTNLLNLAFSDVEYKINFATIPMTFKQAKQILKFLNRIYLPDTTLYINCIAGISRSGAIGKFAQEFFQLDYQEFIEYNRQIIPNSHVYTLLHKAKIKVLF